MATSDFKVAAGMLDEIIALSERESRPVEARGWVRAAELRTLADHLRVYGEIEDVFQRRDLT